MMTDLLEKIKQAYKHCDLVRVEEISKVRKVQFDDLINCNMLLIDDSQLVMAAFIEPLMYATNGNASFLWHRDQSPEQLMDQVVEKKPDVVLIDANLEDGLRGYHLIPLLKNRLPNASFIGFSTAPSTRDAFMAAGAIGFVEKDISDPERNLREIAEVLKNREGKERP